MTDVGLTHIALPVHSLSASEAFYAKYGNMQACAPASRCGLGQ
jgi:hypothetical protein